MNVVKDRQNFLDYSMPPMMLHHLRQVPDPHTGRLFHTARRGRLLPRDELHQSRLPGSILAHKSYLILLTDMEIYAVQQHIAAESHGNITDRNHS